MAAKSNQGTDHGSKVTTDHKKIRQWAEERQGRPATVKGTGGDDEAGILRIDFVEGEPDESLELISWDEFFEKFDEKNLAFLYQEETSSGGQSRFFKFVSQETAQEVKNK